MQGLACSSAQLPFVMAMSLQSSRLEWQLSRGTPGQYQKSTCSANSISTSPTGAITAHQLCWRVSMA
eukprot:289773-Pelagomonas_calceolata.AAC.3